MQVSWIDADELRALANQLLDPENDSQEPTGWELHTLPDVPDDVAGGMLQQAPAVVAEKQRSAPEVVPVTEVEVADPVQMSPEILQIRQRLRAIRDRAQNAGLLQPPPPPPAPPEPEPRQQPQTEAEAPAVNGGTSWPEENHEKPPAPHEQGGEVNADAAPTQDAPVSEAGFGHDESSHAVEAEPTPHVPESGAEQPAHDEAAGGSEPSYHPSPGGIAERLAEFAAWAGHRLGGSQLLIVDDHGDLLWGAVPNCGAIVANILSLQASLRSSAANMHHPPPVHHASLGEDRHLSLIPVTTRYGAVTIGVIEIRLVTESDAVLLRDALTLTVNEASVGGA